MSGILSEQPEIQLNTEPMTTQRALSSEDHARIRENYRVIKAAVAKAEDRRMRAEQRELTEGEADTITRVMGGGL